MNNSLPTPSDSLDRQGGARPGVGPSVGPGVGPGVGGAIWRGLRGRCPSCGEAKLFARFLKQVERCTLCAEPLGPLRPADAAPWLTILGVGPLGVPLRLASQRSEELREGQGVGRKWNVRG